ncbi:glycoside hydrolase family 2 protein [Alistipes senegalensis]|uniref:glycoside hydrolase family 2 protein n=1 Tax=Alistipes senegalensis TaxID=1288121 RepID=UPI00189C1AE1|nr:glycoside hydrolase family 2 TIM barrel-domain containing protein [Alistipes senegalensis]
MKTLTKFAITFALSFLAVTGVRAQDLIANVYGREMQSLNGKWDAVVDLYDQGRKNKIYLNRKPEGKTDFYEYAFENGLRLDVPSDWNSQTPELKYYEGTVWYARRFDAPRQDGRRLFLHFGAVSYRCRVYLNGEEIGSHEGGFTPFQIEVTGRLKPADNFLAVEVNNTRTPDAIPAMAFDWWNYGGITRDVSLVSVPEAFVEDYFIRLDKDSADRISADVRLSGAPAGTSVLVEIPELKVRETASADERGAAALSFRVKNLKRWSPEDPKLYRVIVSAGRDRVEEMIGFRNVRVEGEDIYLNGAPVFLKSVSFHEEIPQRMGRAFSESDAVMLLSEARALGCNMIRLAHYPQNEYIVRLAEKMGFMLWEEIPVWQGIDFANDATRQKAGRMIREMVGRDRNRCALTFWGVANETQPSESRNEFLRYLISCCRELDDTRLIVAAFDLVRFDRDRQLFVMDDPFIEALDVVAVNKYMGWYHPWPVTPDRAVWDVARGKPLIISEFGGEALYGQHGAADTASSWSEEYQEALYRDNLRMFEYIPNLRGVSPWILFDFRSPFRFHPTNQEGWNRKGLVSDRGYRKKAWYLMKAYYDKR